MFEATQYQLTPSHVYTQIRWQTHFRGDDEDIEDSDTLWDQKKYATTLHDQNTNWLCKQIANACKPYSIYDWIVVIQNNGYL